ncbi:hypothetical protein PDE_07380 [Penicillium oxalicum 114-2]|uniref:Uncharacterized protein n=1 Tax=Penicillium oxalicum (strain 114-2 / CGMCC 5302) TaxID=933388 RepID=S7ZP20_PENO1|nr:hypothetical protein PDE_07380 [Penicillium oxalicum 114-2]
MVSKSESSLQSTAMISYAKGMEGAFLVYSKIPVSILMADCIRVQISLVLLGRSDRAYEAIWERECAMKLVADLELNKRPGPFYRILLLTHVPRTEGGGIGHSGPADGGLPQSRRLPSRKRSRLSVEISGATSRLTGSLILEVLNCLNLPRSKILATTRNASQAKVPPSLNQVVEQSDTSGLSGPSFAPWASTQPRSFGPIRALECAVVCRRLSVDRIDTS